MKIKADVQVAQVCRMLKFGGCVKEYVTEWGEVLTIVVQEGHETVVLDYYPRCFITSKQQKEEVKKCQVI